MHIFSIHDDNFRRQIEFNILQKFLKEVKGKKALDIACGKGIITNEFSKQFSEMYGIDYSKSEIEYAKKAYPHIKFTAGDAHNLPYPNDYFDVVFSNCSLEHFKNDKKALKETIRVLKKGGIFATTTEAEPEIINKKINEERKELHTIYNFYTVESLSKKLPGMNIVDSEYYLSGLSLRVFMFITWIGKMVTKSHLALFLWLFNPAVGGFLHKLLFPIIVIVSSKKSNTYKNSIGVAIKAIKK